MVDTIFREAGMATVLERLQELEERAARHEARLAHLEAPARTPERPVSFAHPAASGPAWPAPRPAPPPRVGASRPPRTRPVVEVEDLLGGRVLAWTGGLAVALGLVFLVAMGVSRGWIGEPARVVLAAAGAVALLGAGVRLRERGPAPDAGLAAAAAGIGALFAVIAMAGPGYDLVPATAAILLALAVGASGTVLALRWDTRGLAALGIGGALLAPAIAGAPQDATTGALLWIAAAAGAAVLVHRGWPGFAGAILALTVPQWAGWAVDEATLAGALLALTGFGAVNVAAAVGFQLRRPAGRLRRGDGLVLAANAVVLAGVGAPALDRHGPEALWVGWLLALAAAHAAAGLSAPARRLPRGARVLCLGLAAALADAVAVLVLEDAALVLVLSGSVVPAAAAARHVLARGPAAFREEGLLATAIGVQAWLAGIAALVLVAPEDIADGRVPPAAALLAVAGLALAAFAAARLLQTTRPVWRVALDGAALAAAGYAATAALDGPALVAALCAAAVALAAVAAAQRDDVACAGAAAALAAATTHVLAHEAHPGALVTGPADAAEAAVATGAVAAAALSAAVLLRGRARRWAAGTGLLALLFLASVELVGALAGGTTVTTTQALDAGPDQLSQAALSALWAAAGLGALVAGLARDVRWLRLGALALLLTTVGKVFLLDLAWLEESYRAASFVALGVLLLAGAYAWQRARPGPGGRLSS